MGLNAIPFRPHHLLILLVLAALYTTSSAGSPQTCGNNEIVPSCDFDGGKESECAKRWTNNRKNGPQWTLVKKETFSNGSRELQDWQQNSKEDDHGWFVLFDVNSNKNRKLKKDKSNRLRARVENVPESGAVCITFQYASVKEDGSELTPYVTLLHRNKADGEKKRERDVKIATIDDVTDGKWVEKSFDFCVGNSPFILFESKLVSNNSLVALDHIKITSSTKTCPKENPANTQHTTKTTHDPSGNTAHSKTGPSSPGKRSTFPFFSVPSQAPETPSTTTTIAATTTTLKPPITTTTVTATTAIPATTTIAITEKTVTVAPTQTTSLPLTTTTAASPSSPTTAETAAPSKGVATTPTSQSKTTKTPSSTSTAATSATSTIDEKSTTGANTLPTATTTTTTITTPAAASTTASANPSQASSTAATQLVSNANSPEPTTTATAEPHEPQTTNNANSSDATTTATDPSQEPPTTNNANSSDATTTATDPSHEPPTTNNANSSEPSTTKSSATKTPPNGGKAGKSKDQSSSGLSNGAIIAMGVIFSLLGVILLIALIVVMKRRRRQKGLISASDNQSTNIDMKPISS